MSDHSSFIICFCLSVFAISLHLAWKIGRVEGSTHGVPPLKVGVVLFFFVLLM